jgi:hypothetical protein
LISPRSDDGSRETQIGASCPRARARYPAAAPLETHRFDTSSQDPLGLLLRDVLRAQTLKLAAEVAPLGYTREVLAWVAGRQQITQLEVALKCPARRTRQVAEAY